MGVFGMCERCAWRYCGVPDPQCPICLGTGRIDGGDIEGVDPLVVLRAALMALNEGVPRIRACEARLLGDPGSGVLVEPPFGMSDRSAIGRAAGQLLRNLGLRKVSTPEERAERKREKAAKKERDRIMAEAIERRMQERERELRQRKVDRAAQEAIAAAHPDEYEQEREAQEVFVALEECLPNANVGLHHSVRRRA